jgi:hypothetical protein
MYQNNINSSMWGSKEAQKKQALPVLDGLIPNITHAQ